MARLIVNINDATADALHTYAQKHDVSYTETVRRAVGYLRMVEVAQEAGEKIILRKEDGTEMEVIPL